MHTGQSLGMSRTEVELRERVLEVAEPLREALTSVATAAIGTSLRPTRLSSVLHLDKSVSSRLLRGLRSSSPFELIHRIPSPTGLTKFVDAAKRQGVDPALCQRARGAIEEFQNLLSEFPGGRSALDALIAGSVVEVRDRAEHTAKQAVYKAMSYLLGFQSDTITSALILQPSEDGAGVDGIDVSSRAGVRRIRPNTPVAVFSLALTSEVKKGGPRLEPLTGPEHAADPGSYLIPEFSTLPGSALDMHRSGKHVIFALGEAAASLHAPITLTSAMVIRNGWLPYRTDSVEEDGRSYLLHYPCKLLIRDLFIHEDLYVGAEPKVRLEFPSPMGPASARSHDFPERLNTLDMVAPIEHLGRGLTNAVAPGASEHTRMVSYAFESAGWEPARFRGYRTRIVYPVPMITMGWWIPLPPRS